MYPLELLTALYVAYTSNHEEVNFDDALKCFFFKRLYEVPL